MTPRHGLMVGSFLAAAVAIVLAAAPVDVFADLLDLSDADATGFLVRRYATSATAAIAVFTASVLLRGDTQRGGLLALGTWFGVQGVVAILGVVTDTVGGLAWLAVLADPLIATWFFILSTKSGSESESPMAGTDREVRSV